MKRKTVEPRNKVSTQDTEDRSQRNCMSGPGKTRPSQSSASKGGGRGTPGIKAID